MVKNKIKAIMGAAALLLGINTACSADPLQSANNSADSGAPTPEIARADDRISQAQNQLDTARKQLSAMKAQVKAAEADLKASRAERQALALKNTAQGLADASGLPQSTSATSAFQPGPPLNAPKVDNNGDQSTDSAPSPSGSTYPTQLR